MKIQILEEILKKRRTILAINTLLGALIIIAALVFIRDTISLFAPVRVKAARPEKKTLAIIRHSLQDYAGILKNNPFGFPGGELKTLTASEPGPSTSQSDISLIGTVAGNPAVSFAIFIDKAGQQEIFRVGQQVFSLGKLKKVEPTRVFINANGKSSEIRLKDITQVKEIKSGGAAPATFGRKTGESTYAVDQQRVQHAIERPDQIMTDARFIPNIAEGKQQGFILSEVRPGGIYSSLGLQNGDILLRINEFNISNPETALQAFTALRGIDRAQLDIIRNRSKMTMTYQIR